MELLQKILRKYLFSINIPILLSFFIFLIFSIYITYPLISQSGKEMIENLSVNKNIKLIKVVDSSYVYKIY
jgi:hypothetical protein